MLCAEPQNNAPDVKIPREASRKSLRPNTSESPPKTGAMTVRAMRKPVPHQNAWELEADREAATAGRADDRMTASIEPTRLIKDRNIKVE